MGHSRFLIIETDDRTAHQLSESLCHLDNDTVHIERARSLVESVVFLARDKFDVVFTALELPDSTGLDTLCQIQQVTAYPVIVISDIQDADERELLLRNGACEVIDLGRSREGALELMIKTAMDRHIVVEEKQQKISELIDANIDYARALEELKKVNQRLADEIVRRKDAEQKNTLLAAAIEHLDEALLITDVNDKIVYANPAFERSSGYTPDEIIGADVRVLSDSVLDPRIPEQMRQHLKEGQCWRGKITARRRDNSISEEAVTLSLVRGPEGLTTHVVAVRRDIGKESSLERQLMQAQKMESIGRLAAGIAHEINTPIQYVGDNIHFLADALVDLFGLINEQKALVDRATGCPELSDNAEKIRQHAERIDIDYYCSELPNAVSQAFEGVDRITGIVRAMKEFSHPGGDQKQPTDLNKAIESTVTVCRNEWKYVAELELNLDPNLHEVSCYISEINQAVLNMIVNAAHAIEPKHLATGTKGIISISTRSVDKAVEIRISDTGTGISEEIREKIFDPFFTTKEVGKGTGQGLAIAYSTVTDKHGGTIEVESAVGQGTTFILRLPLTESV